MGQSITPTHVLGLWVTVLAVQVVVTGWWLVHPTMPRKLLLVAAVVEIALGLVLFWLAPVVQGGQPPPGIQRMPHWAFWGLIGPTISGIGMITAALISPRHLRVD
jgi:hypothetical protein